MKIATCIIVFLLQAFIAGAQNVVDQEAIRPIIENQRGDISGVQKVGWQHYTFRGGDSRRNKQAIAEFQHFLDSIPGGSYSAEQKMEIVELANRQRMNAVEKQRDLLVPTSFPEDYRAYSPYPFNYSTAANLPKLFIIDKYTQTFGAYEHGKLVHWGLVSSGRHNEATPPGRYNFNWKVYFKLSNAAPEGEEWRLFWVFDFYAKIGIHVHQYKLPINIPASHGCVRTARPDAEWNYHWANGWVKDGDRLLRNGTPVMVIRENPPGYSAHWESHDGEAHSLIRLPDNFEEVRLGASEQRERPWESGW
jgi:L,D-transpeptidase catalytic domain